MVTQESLKELLCYDPDTGDFTRIKAVQAARVGDIAGCLGNRGYIVIRINGKNYLSHRLAFIYMTGEFPEHHTDHINGNKTDNRWENLRAVTRGENMKNQKKRKSNTSGVMGVYWNKSSGMWQAQIKADGKQMYLGIFADINDAITARKQAEIDCGFHPNHGRS